LAIVCIAAVAVLPASASAAFKGPCTIDGTATIYEEKFEKQVPLSA
jgi:hypothetical protein